MLVGSHQLVSVRGDGRSDAGGGSKRNTRNYHLAQVRSATQDGFGPMWQEGGRATAEATEEKSMQLSARNQLQGTVIDVRSRPKITVTIYK